MTKANDKKRKPLGLIRPVGSITQTNQEEILKSDAIDHIEPKKKKVSNKKHTMKIPENIYQKMQIVKKINNNKYDYDVIEFLIDDYVNNAPNEDAQFYHMLYKKIDK